MTALSLISMLLLVAALSAWLNNRFLKLPSAIGVMTVSLIFSFGLIILGKVGAINISEVSSIITSFNFQSLLLHGLLAFLLFAGGLTIDLEGLNSQKGAVTVLSTVGVVIATTLVGFLFWISLSYIGVHIPFVIALLFGAIVSPTDAVAVLGILKKVGVPKSLEIKVVGESLFNDGVSVVVFLAVSSIAFGEKLSPSEVAIHLAVSVLGGFILGLVLGWITYRMLKAIDEYVVEILLTLVLASGGYALAESLHVSAPIFAVVSGLIIGNQGRAFAMSELTKQHLDTFWELIDELLNVVLFVLMGLEIITLGINRGYIFAGLIGIFAVTLSRFISVYISVSMLKGWRSFSPHAVKIISWGGLRGGISVALALSLSPGEHHDLLVVATYLVVLFSVLIQGSTLPILLRRSRKSI